MDEEQIEDPAYLAEDSLQDDNTTEVDEDVDEQQDDLEVDSQYLWGDSYTPEDDDQGNEEPPATEPAPAPAKRSKRPAAAPVASAAPAPAPETTPAPPAPKKYVPPPITPYTMTTEEEEAFNALALENPAAAMRQAVQHGLQMGLRAHNQGLSAVEYNLRQFAASRPEIFAEFEPQIRQVVASFTPEQLANPQAADWAILNAIGGAYGTTGDLLGTLDKLTTLNSRRTQQPVEQPPTPAPAPRPQAQQRQDPAPRQQPQPARTMPPAQRMPAGANTGGRPSASAGRRLSTSEQIMRSIPGVKKSTISNFYRDIDEDY